MLKSLSQSLRIKLYEDPTIYVNITSKDVLMMSKRM